MLPTYNGFSAIETVYTYDKRKIRQRKERLYYIKQRLTGLTMTAIGVIAPFLLDGDATVSLFALPLGIFLLLTKERVMTF